MLRSCAKDVEAENTTDEITTQRITNMLAFVESTSEWYDKIREVPTSTLQKLMKLGAGITSFVSK